MAVNAENGDYDENINIANIGNNTPIGEFH